MQCSDVQINYLVRGITTIGLLLCHSLVRSVLYAALFHLTIITFLLYYTY